MLTSRIAAAIALVALTTSCAALQWEPWLVWTPCAEGTYAPLPDDAHIQFWVEPPPHDVFDAVLGAENPRIGLGPPGGVVLARWDGWDLPKDDGPTPASVARFAKNPNVARVAQFAKNKARELGGDAVVIRQTPAFTFEIVRSQP